MNLFENPDEIAQFTSQNLWGEESIDLKFRMKAQHNRDEIGLSGYSICEDQFVKLNYAYIQSVVDKIARQMLFWGLSEGDVLAVQLPNSVETQILYLACWQQGITVAPLPSLWREIDVKRALIRISPQAFICPIIHDGFNYAELMYKIGFDISSLKMLLSLGGNPVDGCVSLDEYFKHQPKHDVNLLKPADYTKVDANSPCLITFSKDQNGNETPYYHTHNQLLAAANVFNSQSQPAAQNTIINPFQPTSLTICATTIVSWVQSATAMTCYDGLMATEFQNIEIDQANLYLPGTFDEENLVKALFEQGLNKLIFITKIDSSSITKKPNANIIDVTTFGEFAFIPQIRNGSKSKITFGKYEFKLGGTGIVDSISFGEWHTKDAHSAWKISCSFLPNNVIKQQNSYKSDIFCQVNKAADDAKLHIGNMTLIYAEIEQELASYHGVEDVAIMAFHDNLMGLKPIIAIVPKVGAVILHHELVEFLKAKNIAAYKIPLEVYKIPNIPRDYDNNTIRLTSKKELLKLVGPQNNGNSDGLMAVQQELAALLANA